MKASYALIAIALSIVLIVVLLGNGQNESRAAAPTTQDEKIQLIHAQRFDLGRAARHRWRLGAPLYESGWLLVLEVDPTKVLPRQSKQPVLYVGAQTAERINVGYESGHVVAIVPGDFFLVDALIFFGDPALPEEIDTAHCERQLAAAQADGAVAPTTDQVTAAMHEPLRLADAVALRNAAIDLVEVHAPDEQDLIQGSRVPLVK